MPLVNVQCPICCQILNDPDDVYATSCGHLFHFLCLNDWNKRSTNCRQCHCYSPSTFKLYLQIDNTAESELELKLKKSKKEQTLLLVEVADMETNFLQLHEQLTNLEIEKKELDLKMRQVNDTDQNFLKLHDQHTKLSAHVKQLEDRFNALLKENEYKTKEWNLRSLVKESYKTGIWKERCVLNDTTVGKKLWTLEQKLKHVTEELKEQISQSTKLTFEKMDLERRIKQLDENNSAVNTTLQQGRKSPEIVKATNENAAKSFAPSAERQRDSNYHKYGIFIKEISPELIVLPLENIIIKLATYLELSITADDIVDIEILHANADEPAKTKLVVQFKSKQLPGLFLTRKSTLQKHPVMRSIVIRELLSDDVLELLHYAKEKLQNHSFKHFFYKNGQVFAKKTRSHPKVVHIPNKSHVDMLYEKN